MGQALGAGHRAVTAYGFNHSPQRRFRKEKSTCIIPYGRCFRQRCQNRIESGERFAFSGAFWYNKEHSTKKRSEKKEAHPCATHV